MLYQTISQYIMTTRRFMNPHLMTQMRMQCVRNSNLEEVFDTLNLKTLLPKPLPQIHMKSKADVVVRLFSIIPSLSCIESY